ncbi:GGDEF domain-containing protein [Candidatus Cetobacterium colombiensis]|uniref:GGDEF domain-containing protein n=1 Tax=Candidatus Cetobacterium colombiensis TaxID=3073100 RepID=A0ABU4W8S1_9FUSO|nr:GGDEF domain-containing protein [Candidatus Cetobacterium colombiensis]MDX8335913.1 GGDEF domain-containing protein [Candidatus Cetobacterium colombiensis]
MIYRITYIFLTILLFVSTFINKNNISDLLHSKAEIFNTNFEHDIHSLSREIEYLNLTKSQIPLNDYKTNENIDYLEVNGTGIYFKNISSLPKEFYFYNLNEAKSNLNSSFSNSLLGIVYNEIKNVDKHERIVYTSNFSLNWVGTLKTTSLTLTFFETPKALTRNNTQFLMSSMYVDNVFNKKMFTITFPEYDYKGSYFKLKALWYFDFNGDFFAKNANLLKEKTGLNVVIIDEKNQVVYSTNNIKNETIEDLGKYHFFPLHKTTYKILIEKESFLHLLGWKEFILILVALILTFYATKKQNLEKEIKSLKIERKIKKRLLLRDPLTDLYNRYFLQEEIKFPLKNCGVVLIDIDHFKTINDTFGHDNGDYVLKGVSNCIKLITLNKGYPFRWGGEEFLIIFYNMSEDEILKKVYSLQNLIRNLDLIKNHKVTASFGITFCDLEDRTSLYSAVSKADEKLYIAKKTGRDKIVQ